MLRVDLLRVLESVTMSAPFAWEWAWEIAAIGGGAFLVRVTFARPDRDTGAMGRGFGRWLHVAPDETEHSVIGTAFVAIKLIVEHELLEAFHVNGRRPFDPHGAR